jgi:hypothetical protein
MVSPMQNIKRGRAYYEVSLSSMEAGGTRFRMKTIERERQYRPIDAEADGVATTEPHDALLS